MTLTSQNLERLQADNADLRMELVNGEIIVMSPSGYESDEVASAFSAELRTWVKPRKLGRITGAGAGFKLTEVDTLAPDVSFVRADRLRRSPRKFAELAPDLMVEVKSPSDSLKKLRDKIDQFLAQGTIVGILIHPEQRWLEIRRPNRVPVTLQDGEVLTLPDLFPGWQVSLSDLWPVEFD